MHRADAFKTFTAQGQGLLGVSFGDNGFFHVQAGSQRGISSIVLRLFGRGVANTVKASVARQAVAAAGVVLGQHVIELRLCSVRRYYALRLCSRLRLHLLLELLLLELCLLRHCALSGSNRSGAILCIPTIHEGNLNFLGGVTISGRGRDFNTEHIAQVFVNSLHFFQPGPGHLNAIQEGAIHNVGMCGRGSEQDAVTLTIQGVGIGHHLESLRLTQTGDLVDDKVLFLRDFQLTRKNLSVERLILSVCRQQLQGCRGVVGGVFRCVALAGVNHCGRDDVLLVGVEGTCGQGQLGAEAATLHVEFGYEGHRYGGATTQRVERILAVFAHVDRHAVTLNRAAGEAFTADGDTLGACGVNDNALLYVHLRGILGSSVFNGGYMCRGGRIIGLHRSR